MSDLGSTGHHVDDYSATHFVGIVAATETEQALSLQHGFAYNIGVDSETDAAQPVAISRTRTIVAGAETDAAQALHVVFAEHFSITSATETEQAQSLSYQKNPRIIAATETDSAQNQSYDKRKAIVPAGESDTAIHLLRDELYFVSHSSEADSARPLSFHRGDDLDCAQTNQPSIVDFIGEMETSTQTNVPSIDDAVPITIDKLKSFQFNVASALDGAEVLPTSSQQNVPRAEDDADTQTVVMTNVPTIIEDTDLLTSVQEESHWISDLLTPGFPSGSQEDVIPAVMTNVPSIKDRIRNTAIFGVGPGTGGEGFRLRLAPNGQHVDVQLVASITADTSYIFVDSVAGLPTDSLFAVYIDGEEILIEGINGSANLLVAWKRGIGGTVAAPHSAGATARWDDHYDMGIYVPIFVRSSYLNEFGFGEIYPAWLIAADCTQAYLADTDTRYAFNVTEFHDVLTPGGPSKIDAPQPSAVQAITGLTDECPAALTVPVRVTADLEIGDYCVVRYVNPEAYELDLGPRSVFVQTWYGFKRVDDFNNDVTLITPYANIIDGTAAHDWGTSGPQEITELLPAADRYFTNPAVGYDDVAWGIGVLTIRQGEKKVPFWSSWNWHNFDWVFTGFGPDYNFCQVVANRNQFLGTDYEWAGLHLPGTQDDWGPNVFWEGFPDFDYVTSSCWMVVLNAGPYIVGPPINPIVPDLIGGGGGSAQPPVIAGGIGVPAGTGPGIQYPIQQVEGGEGGDISLPVGEVPLDGIALRTKEEPRVAATDDGQPLDNVRFRASDNEPAGTSSDEGIPMEGVKFRAQR